MCQIIYLCGIELPHVFILGIEEQIFKIFRVIRVVRVPENITRITQTNFGFLQSLSEIVIG
jgi:hypothetical protein